MTDYLSVSQVARRLKVAPRQISDLFYRRLLPDDSCPILAQRRIIPSTYIEEIEAALKRHGRIVAKEGGVSD